MSRKHAGRHALPKPPRSLQAVVLAILAIVGYATLTGASSPANAMAKVKCKVPVGQSQADPIVHHNQPVSTGHLHTFFGNAALLSLSNPNTATYSQLAGKSTQCENPDDTAAYWSPSLVYTSGANAGKPVPIKAFTAYYRSYDHKETGTAAPLPADLRLVAGNPDTTTLQDTKIVNWSCGQYSSVGPTPYIPNCATATGSVVQLTAHVEFPSCWDGKLSDHTVTGDTRDNAHFAYPKSGVCPSGFPNKMAQLGETIIFSYAGTGSDVALTSDLMARQMGVNVKNGQTLHADYWNTWVQSGGAYGGMVGMVHDCVNTTSGSAAECG